MITTITAETYCHGPVLSRCRRPWVVPAGLTELFPVGRATVYRTLYRDQSSKRYTPRNCL